MPKISNTRKQREIRVYNRIHEGPSILTGIPFSTLTEEQVKEVKKKYRLWVETWILPELYNLLPEVKKAYQAYIENNQGREPNKLEEDK